MHQSPPITNPTTTIDDTLGPICQFPPVYPTTTIDNTFGSLIYQFPPSVHLTTVDEFLTTTPVHTQLPDYIFTPFALASSSGLDRDSQSAVSITDFSNVGDNYEHWLTPTAISASGAGESELPDVAIPDTSEELEEVTTGDIVPTSAQPDFHEDLAWRTPNNDVWGSFSMLEKRELLNLMSTTCWWIPMVLMKVLSLGGLWVGLYGNPFIVPEPSKRCLITSSFLTALKMEGKTYEDMLKQPCACFAFWIP
jgi:hypothetical protein